MDVAAQLSKAAAIDKEIKQLIIAKREAFEHATQTTQYTSGERVQTSGENSAERYSVEYAHYSDLISKRINELFAAKRQNMEIINHIPERYGACCSVMLARYINLHSFARIARDLNYSLSAVYKIHSRALEILERELAAEKD